MYVEMSGICVSVHVRSNAVSAWQKSENPFINSTNGECVNFWFNLDKDDGFKWFGKH